MAYIDINPFTNEPSYYEDDEEPPKNSWGGSREGSGRKEGKTKESIQVTLDIDLLDQVDELGGKRSTQINKILRLHFDRMRQMIKDAESTE